MCKFDPPRKRVLSLYANFLEKHDMVLAKSWGLRCNDDLEAASCEADAWATLTALGASVTPNKDKNEKGRSVDFLCRVDDKAFYCEVTCITIQTMADYTHESHSLENDSRTRGYHTPIEAVRRECSSKAPQCANWNHPTILLVGTYHFQSSRLFAPRTDLAGEYFTGRQDLQWPLSTGGQSLNEPTVINVATGTSSSFVDEQFHSARKSVSAVILAGFGHQPPKLSGLLHPDAARPLDHSLLPDLVFHTSKADRISGTMTVLRV